jgi:ectoine hydroxylase-related dioxygenase (phytanoyl-CoA dioxygenase family)
MKPFYDVHIRDLSRDFLRDQIDSKGYILLRDLLPTDVLTRLLDEITKKLSAAGWLLRGHNPLDRFADSSAACGDPDPSFKRTYQEIFALELFHALPHHPALQHVMNMIVGKPLLIHPKPIGRLIFPHCDRLRVHAHQDHRFMGGDIECYTAWIPLHDCSTDIGPLQILQGSHRFGFQPHDDASLHVPEIPSGKALGTDWVGGQINAGDALIFHSLTVHAAAPNLSKQLRISLDCRFQDARRVVNPANLAFAGESGKSWEKIYAGWHSDKLKYYWKGMPLNFQPSKLEIEQLSKTADTASARAKYARILGQLD